MVRPIVFILLFVLPLAAEDLRREFLLENNWKFTKGSVADAQKPDFGDSSWENVTVPHDWAIYGPFDLKADAQNVAVAENFETKPSVKTGRTGALPFTGIGWYRTKFNVTNFSTEKRVTLLFDGAMSEAKVFVNGKEAGEWKNGYNSFHLDATGFINENGKDNVLAVRLENLPESSRWYPGAGLYRNVHVIVTNKIHVPVWGTFITTPFVSADAASVKLQISLANAPIDETVRLQTEIFDSQNVLVTTKDDRRKVYDGVPLEQHFTVNAPQLWSPESPKLYRAVTKIYVKDQPVDEYTTRFGIRSIEYIADKGFFLNGKRRKFKGVCNHHDLGPLGAAVNTAALRRQLVLLQEMGCDSVRTSHNMPAPELVALCDELGLMMMVESFDEWEKPKCRNGYNRFYKDWAEKDLVNMVRHYRNNPSVVMWSIGNEVSEQSKSGGHQYVEFLQGICHREDPTRPVTFGMSAAKVPLYNGFADALDIPGLNYRTAIYEESYQVLRQNLILGSETASAVSSRGVYKFPVEQKKFGQNRNLLYPDYQCSSYDFECCFWSNIPDVDFALADDFEWTLGQFVWTGFDYLGEPTPYDSLSPNHSSMFGIIDLASIPKDRYYLYRSVWKPEAETLHIVPHWNWEGREGAITPVFVYTNYPSAELFINGKSQGRQTKAAAKEFAYNNENVTKRYRLMWTDTKYEPGEVKVVAYDSAGKAAAEKTVKTAGKPHRVELIPDRKVLLANGKDLSYITVRVVDKDGNFCPREDRLLKFRVTGCGTFRSAANGDPTSLELFHLPQMHTFNGQLTAIVQSGTSAGEIDVEFSSEGLQSGKASMVSIEYKK